MKRNISKEAIPIATNPKSQLKVSVITVCYNNRAGLSATIQSVINQTYSNVEIVVIDGGSIDGVEEVIRGYEGKVDFFSSKKDRGIFDAMNKGMEVASGDFCIFLNSGDVFYTPTVIEEFTSVVSDLNVVYYGRACIVGDKAEWFFPDNSFDAMKIASWIEVFEPNHQSMFFPRSFYRKHKYDIKLRYTGDHDFKVLARQTCGYIFLDFVVCKFFMGGVSNNNSFNVQLRRIKESLFSLGRTKGRLGLKIPLYVGLQITSFFLNKMFPKQYHWAVMWYHKALSYYFYSFIKT